MLVLSRKPSEKIMIGHEIVLTVLEVRGDNVKLGIQAPRTVSIHREEIYEEIRKANQQAVSKTQPATLDQWLPKPDKKAGKAPLPSISFKTPTAEHKD